MVVVFDFRLLAELSSCLKKEGWGETGQGNATGLSQVLMPELSVSLGQTYVQPPLILTVVHLSTSNAHLHSGTSSTCIHPSGFCVKQMEMIYRSRDKSVGSGDSSSHFYRGAYCVYFVQIIGNYIFILANNKNALVKSL